jgi:hypothetical protein
VTDEPSKPVSMSKGAAEPAARNALPPRTVLYAVGAMVVCGVSALIAAVDIYLPAVKHWLTTQKNDSNLDNLKDALKASSRAAAKSKCVNTSGLSKTDKQACSTFHDSVTSLSHDVATTQKGLLISVLVALIALGFIAFSTYRGRYWSRWGVLGLWFLASFTGTLIGIQSALTIASDIPAAYKFPAFLSSITLIAAVVMVNLRPSVEFFAANRPVVPEGARGAGRPRRGLFSPPPPRQPRTRPGDKAAAKANATTRPAAAPTDRSRSKRRADTAAVAKGADLARTRAKAASKSRRTES